MYFFVPYNISPIQQAIQAGHAALEYAWEYPVTPEYIDFMKYKTWIILNGGTTNRNPETTPEGKLQTSGSLNRIYESLCFNEIRCSMFSEPDLNDALTAVCFLADERVWDYENYLDFYDWLLEIKINPEYKYAMDLKNPQIRRYTPEQFKYSFPEFYKQWTDEILGGEKNEFLRNLIRGKKLA